MDHESIHENQLSAPSVAAGQYPMLLLPKKCAPTILTNQRHEEVNIKVKIMAHTKGGPEMCIYEGFCCVKVLDKPNLVTMNFAPRDDESEDPTAANQQQYAAIDRDLTRSNTSHYQNNSSYDPNQSWQYPVSYQTHSQHVTIEHHNTYITQNVYNFNDSAVRFSPHETFARQRQLDIETVKRSIPNQSLDFHEETDRSVQRIVKMNAYNVDDSGIADTSANSALLQLLSPDIEQMSKERKTILYSGPDDGCGQTIHQVGDKDPTAECCSAAMEVDNEVIIDSLAPTHRNKKNKYECANCEQTFDQLSNFREHQKTHTNASQSDKIRYNCSDCGKTLTTREKFIKHVLAHGDPDLECPKCGNVFASKNTLRVHLKIHSRKYHCNFCVRSYNDLEPLTAHLASFHSRYECETCNYLAHTKKDLLAHQKVHKIGYAFYDNNIDSIASHSRVRDWVCENNNENQENRETADAGCNTLKNYYENLENREITEAAYILSGEKINKPSTFQNENQYIEQLEIITNTESTHLFVQDEQVEIECTFDNDKSNSNNDIINSADQPIIRENSVQTSPQPHFDENQIKSTGNGVIENHFEIEVDGSNFCNKENLINDKRSQFNENESHIDENGKQTVEKRSNYDEEESSIDEEASTFDDNASQSDGNGNPFDENGSQIDEKESQFDENGSRFDDTRSQYSNGTFHDTQDDSDDEDFKICIEEGSNHNKSYRINESIIEKAIASEAFKIGRSKKSRQISKVCDICDKVFNRMSDLKRHLIEHVVRMTLAQLPATRSGILHIECQVCRRATFSKVDQYKVHLRKHAKLTLYQCTFCNKSFSDSSNFCKHKKIHGDTYFQCDICLRKFNSKETITRHMEYHENNAPMPCPVCGETFHFKSTLNKHIKNAHSIATSKFKCRFCSKHFETSKVKWDHEWVAHKIRKVIADCSLCGAKFRKLSELKRHSAVAHKVVTPPSKKKLLKKLNT